MKKYIKFQAVPFYRKSSQVKLSRTKPEMPFHEWQALKFCKLLLKQEVSFKYIEFKTNRSNFYQYDHNDYVMVEY